MEPARLPLERLAAVWFQVTGLLCNLECTHCLVDSSPRNDSMPFMSRESIRGHLARAAEHGVKEIYFTGGEPFLHREMPEILLDALAVAPTTVLTNGTLITEPLAARLGEIFRAARYSLEVRVSLDHPDPGRNDAVRGAGAHAKAMRAILRLAQAGLLPILTATELAPAPHAAPGDTGLYEAFRRLLLTAGVSRPRIKVLPVFHLGKLEDPARGGPVTPAMLEAAPVRPQCAESRAVTAQGVYACPILVGRSSAFLGASLEEPVTLSHPACRTCLDTGMTCRNA